MSSSLRITGFGNPLLDVSAVVEQTVLDEWGVKLNDAILAEDKHMPLYQKFIDSHPVEYIAGGATQNSIRVAQWMLGIEGGTAYVGSVGKDANGETLEKTAKADGVDVNYMLDTSAPTGVCAVLVNGSERSLVTSLGAANNYDTTHFDTPKIQAIVEATQIFYIAGFFLTVSPPTIEKIGQHVAASGKTLCMNISAPFIAQFFKDPLAAALPYCDFVFGNESEAAAFGKENGWGEDVAAVALKLAALPKASGTRPRVVVFTQGSEQTIVACGGQITNYAVPKMEKETIVDTNGAGDSFVGGFLAYLAKGSNLEECVTAGHWAARQILQVSGCKVPKDTTYKP